MRRLISLAIVFVLCWSLFDDVLYAQLNCSETPEAETETKVIDLTADIVYPITLNDTVEVMCLVGNFAAQHNGAIITADSAVRYNDKRLECFGNVLINKNTTYAYADRAEYNGEENEVSLHAPIVKVVDGEATLYCYNFVFNTLDNIGTYEGGGVMINGESVMESISGYYYSDNKELIGVGDVELHGDEYEMMSDSIIYNTETEGARYFDKTNIWNKKDEYLYADAGDYDKAADRYSFSLNGYILTEEQEMWSDSMDYYRASDHIYMRHNIQVDDTTQKSLIFGDFGEYIKNPGDMTLVGNPSIINYDPAQGDSLFMRADTFQIFTLNRFEADTLASIAAAQAAEIIQTEEPTEEHNHEHDHMHDHEHGHEHDHAAPQKEEIHEHEEEHEAQPSIREDAAKITAPRVDVGSSSHNIGYARTEDEEKIVDSLERVAVDSLDSLSVDSLMVDSLAVDSLAVDSLARLADTLNFWQRIKAKYVAAYEKRAAIKMERDAARKVILDSIGRQRQIKINEKLDAEKVREARQVAQRKAKIAAREAKKLRRAVSRGKIAAADTVELMKALEVDTNIVIEPSSWRRDDSLAMDSLAVDSLRSDSLSLDSLSADTVAIDSLYRLTKGYRNVKIYRSDFQAVADSMVSNSLDSIIRLYINPVMWYENSQVTSDEMEIYTDSSRIKKAIFTGGTPIMSSEVEPEVYYNQIAGKKITTLFANGEAYRTDADGNAQTLYFMQDEETQDVTGLMVMTSGSATFYIEDQTVVGITYRAEPNYIIYPMNLIPADQALFLKDYKWQGSIRPVRDSVFNRTIRPSVRKEKSAIERPKFPIQEALEKHRRELIDSGQWLDRDDLVSPHAEEWMESLGYKTGQPREENK